MPVTDRSKLTALTPNLQNGQQADPLVLKEAVVNLFDTVDANFSGASTELNAHIASATAHTAQNITYTGNATGTNVKAAIDGLKTTLDSVTAGSANDTNIGNRTIVDTSAPTGDTGTLTTLLGWLGNMIKQITGKSNWRTTPRTTLENAVKRDGDTMTGNLIISNTAPIIQLNETDTGKNFYLVVDGNNFSIREDGLGASPYPLEFNGATNTLNTMGNQVWDASKLRDNNGSLEFFTGGAWKSVGGDYSFDLAMGLLGNNTYRGDLIQLASDKGVTIGNLFHYILGAPFAPYKTLSMSQIAADVNAVNQLIANALCMDVIARSAIALNALVKTTNLSAAWATAVSSRRGDVLGALADTAYFTKVTGIVLGNGPSSVTDGLGTNTFYIPVLCLDDGDTIMFVADGHSNATLITIGEHSGNIPVTTGVSSRGVRVGGSGSSIGNVTFDKYTAV